MKRTGRYILQAIAGARREGLRWTFAVVRDFPRWWVTVRSGSPLNDGSPWITFGAERHLRAILPRVSRAFEYGSGGSTVYLSEFVSELVSVEHDPEWSALVSARIDNRANVRPELHPPTLGGDGTYTSTDERYVGLSFRDYAAAIDRFPNGHFDLIVIDGRARVACFRHALPKLNPEGWLVLDNSDRPEYQEIIEGMEVLRWTAHHHYGPGPYIPKFWRTTIWRSNARRAP